MKSSEEKESNYVDGDSLMRVLSIPLPHIQAPHAEQNFNFNLLDGYISIDEGGFRPCDSSSYGNTGLYNILLWIKHHSTILKGPNRLIDYDFVCKNGTLRRILDLLHEDPKQKDLCIAATEFLGTIYLYTMTTDKIRDKDRKRSEKANMRTWAGFRFEKHISKLVYGHGNESEDHQSHGDHHLVLSSQFGVKGRAYTLLYSAEMDCVADEGKMQNPEPGDFFEIKTIQATKQKETGDSRGNRTGSHWTMQATSIPCTSDEWTKKIMFRWWSQAYCSGVPAVVVGHREEKDFHVRKRVPAVVVGHREEPDFRVRKTEIVETDQMSGMCKDYWNSENALWFLHRFLQFVRETVVEKNPNVMYEFSWGEPDPKYVYSKKTTPRPDRRVLPDWYIDLLNSLARETYSSGQV